MFRIGVNLGDVVVEGDDLFGDGVNVAARLEGLADPGGVCISGNAYEQVRQRLDLRFEDIGPQKLKNIAAPVAAYRLASGSSGTTVAVAARARRRTVPALALLIAVLAAGGGLYWWQGRERMPPEITSASSAPTADATALPAGMERRLKIAVLPFQTTSASDDDRWLGDGIAEDIMTDLSRFRDIGVIARNSSFRYGATPDDISVLRSDLGADFVLQGSARLLGDRMRLSLQLVDTETGTNIWAERYDRPFDEVFSVKVDILKQISARPTREHPMTAQPSHQPVSALGERMIEDISVRGFTAATRRDTACWPRRRRDCRPDAAAVPTRPRSHLPSAAIQPNRPTPNLQIPIDRAPDPAGSFPSGFRTPAPACVASVRQGPASETRRAVHRKSPSSVPNALQNR